VNTTFLGIAGKSLGVSILILMLMLLFPAPSLATRRRPILSGSLYREARTAC
jgi:hypothetical protein